jgi:hypothetical protein
MHIFLASNHVVASWQESIDLQILCFLQRFNQTSLLKMWVNWDEHICWEVYKITLMIHPSQLCLSSNFIEYQFIEPLTCAISMKVQIELFLFYFFWYPCLWYLFPFSKHPNYLLSLVDICDVFYVFMIEVHECTIR